ncbi:MAG TPA: sulfurtransferase [Jatrophihabitans sp.]|nr:sulfurtransferase [Jatrophihabitans sp.]
MPADFPRALVSVAALAELIASPAPPVILDVRWRVGQPALYEDYLAGHLPGARWCDLDRDLAGPPGAAGRHPLPAVAVLQRALTRWGVHDTDRVVVYDGDSGVAAARAWWVLRWVGLVDVRVLDGGYAAWLAADQPVSTDVPPAGMGTAVARPGALPVLDADEAAHWGRAGRLLDVRAPERYRGEVEPIDPVAGHIPGAVNVPTTGNVDETGRFLSPEAIRQRFARHVTAATSDGGQPLGVYCGSGVTAAHTVLALHEAGVPAVLYPGSWSEWITDPGRPIATAE